MNYMNYYLLGVRGQAWSLESCGCGRTTIFQGVDDQVPWLIWGSGNVDHLTVIEYPSGAAVCLADLFVDRSGVFEPQPWPCVVRQRPDVERRHGWIFAINRNKLLQKSEKRPVVEHRLSWISKMLQCHSCSGPRVPEIRHRPASHEACLQNEAAVPS